LLSYFAYRLDKGAISGHEMRLFNHLRRNFRSWLLPEIRCGELANRLGGCAQASLRGIPTAGDARRAGGVDADIGGTNQSVNSMRSQNKYRT
jgi:hypothetical protein